MSLPVLHLLAGSDQHIVYDTLSNPNYELKRCHLDAIPSREIIPAEKESVTSIAIIMQGDPVWAISQATISDLIGLSLNFFFVLPLLNSGTLKSSNFLIYQPKQAQWYLHFPQSNYGRDSVGEFYWAV